MHHNKAMKRTRIVCITLGGVLFGNMASANVTPPNLSRIRNVVYQDNHVITLKGQTFTSTQLVFGVNERILNVDGGDTAGWMATYKKNLPNLLFLKPTIAGSDSNLTVITTRHTYYFHVISEAGGINSPLPAPYAVKFSYPNDVRLQLQATLSEKRRHRTITANAKKGAAAKIYNYNYTFNGAPELRPVHVFDDGIFTYFELAPNQPIPAVFVVDNQKGEESIVNIRRKDALLIVHRTAPQFTLRLGKHQVASVFNNAQIASTSFRRHS